ncbi:MAG TPA: disulfide bond formation protein B [Pseudomonadales bacterium]|nr:disulfide bond formation protein B [Pseudomonadales bacterium]
MTLPSSRTIFLIVFLGCAGLICTALFMQYVMHWEPCPLCILQRIMVITTGTIALIAALHNPRELGVKVYGGLVTLSAVLGGMVSIRHIYLQSLPPDQVPSCGPGLDYLMQVFSLFEVLKQLLVGDGTCATILFQFLGLSIPGWTLVAFIGLAAIGIYQFSRPKISFR